MTGFEPATSGSTIRRSNQLSYTHHTKKTVAPGSEAEKILTKREEDPQLYVIQPLASKAACISVRIAAAAAAGSEASLMGRPTTK